MQLWVTTYEPLRHLAGPMEKLLSKFWPEVEPNFHVSEKPYADALLDLMDQVEGDHFILMHEDMYILKPVDVARIRKAERFVVANLVDRFGLQGINDGYVDSVTQELSFYRLDDRHQYLCSFEASIFRKEFLRDILVPGEGPHATEVNGSRRARGARVYMYKEPVLTYKDAMIHGQERIFFHDNELFLKVGDDLWENTHVSL